MVKRMAQDPIIFALANPNPEIYLKTPSGASRCDYRHRSLWLSKPSKTTHCVSRISSVARLTSVPGNRQLKMKIACVRAIAAIAHVEATHKGQKRWMKPNVFGREYLIPGPLEPNLIWRLRQRLPKLRWFWRCHATHRKYACLSR